MKPHGALSGLWLYVLEYRIEQSVDHVHNVLRVGRALSTPCTLPVGS